MLRLADPADMDILTPLFQYGLPGIFIFLFLSGWLIPKGVHDSMREERDNWRKAFETEQSAHQLTRDASVESNRRTDAAVEVARTAAATLNALHHLSNSKSS